MKTKLFLSTAFIAIFIIQGCNQKNNKSHTDTLIIVNNDFNRYESLFVDETIDLYKQIEKASPKDSVKKILLLKAFEIQKHSNDFIQSIDKLITDKSDEYSLKFPSFNKYYKSEWLKLSRENFNLSNQYDVNSAFNIKEALTSFQMHLIYINQKNIHSKQLEDFLKTSIQTYNYIYDETWENTLIVDKTTLDLITILNKIKFEAKISEFMTIKYLKAKLDE